MKLIYVANIRLPTEKAHGLQVMKMCEAFASVGAEVTLVVPRRLNPIQDDPFSYYCVKKSFSIVRLPTLDTVRFGKLGFLVQAISFAEFVFWYLLFKKVDVVYSRDEIPLFDLGVVKRNLVWETHVGSYNIFARFVLARSKKVVTISDGLKTFYLDKGIREEKIIVAHDGADLDEFSERPSNALKQSIRKKLGVGLDKKVALYVGRIDSWKGVETLLAASKILPADVQVVIIGGEDAQIAKQRSRYPKVMFKGFMPYRDLHQNQQAADVLVVPHTAKNEISRSYTSPLKVFAHMASGIPIIAADLPSIREVLNDKNSYLVRPDDAEVLAQTIVEVTSNPKISKKRASAALRDVGNYTWQRRADYILSEIQK